MSYLTEPTEGWVRWGVTTAGICVLSFAIGFVIGCATLEKIGQAGCEALIVTAEDQAVRWTEAIDEDKAEEAAEYASIVADLLSAGCVFLPPPSAPPVEIVP